MHNLKSLANMQLHYLFIGLQIFNDLLAGFKVFSNKWIIHPAGNLSVALAKQISALGWN